MPEFGTPAYVERFRLMAKEFTAKYSTKEAALELMQREGILDAKGKLSKNYSAE
ncbi:hypothetical protein [Labrys monachus]|uniref:Uncharacterized protein n=1 Tax=Labrys monachus TaxID=217067 RepID=A0ABU0F8U6_9HYPH|nr:hypothetical protein [Labrys monachus]MDQ0391033.1 hypothetical protein [Labrys monachus]